MKKRAFIFLFFALLFNYILSNQAEASEQAKKWTFMVFLNADNNLDRYGVQDVQEMENAAVSKDVNVVVQIDRFEKPARRYDVSGRVAGAVQDDWGLCSKISGELGEVDMGDYKEVVKFVKWSCDNYPAEKYALVIWNHGSGWRKFTGEFKGISSDDQSGNRITTKQLGVALSEIHGILKKPVDVFGMDACLMQMIEVAYEIKENALYISASEETEPARGWPYDLILASLVNNPDMPPRELAVLIPSAYAESYSNKPSSTTQSTIDCSMLDDLAKAVSEFATAVIDSTTAGSENEVYFTAFKNVQKYAFIENIDLGHFIKLVSDKTKDKKVLENAQKALMCISKAVIQNKITGLSAKNSTGLAIFFPKHGMNSVYSAIKFSNFNWDEMVRRISKLQQ